MSYDTDHIGVNAKWLDGRYFIDSVSSALHCLHTRGNTAAAQQVFYYLIQLMNNCVSRFNSITNDEYLLAKQLYIFYHSHMLLDDRYLTSYSVVQTRYRDLLVLKDWFFIYMDELISMGVLPLSHQTELSNRFSQIEEYLRRNYLSSGLFPGTEPPPRRWNDE